ncbi:hypothetical protein [Psychroflexus planctonicus]|uniref:Uncharacterized protein n=1 Tax=Psychroflexus planctonicus TaxID=1526575 RepID=A0ABQ1SF00_9FLAO|nr:hypothetical protein [Psychroflexus planctonicus]GGE28904.1 hypothetical protein GCM10010832_06930 [Psychroflexus planctonicus]
MKLDNIISDIEKTLNSNQSVDDEVGLGIYLTESSVEYHWYLNNLENHKSDYSIRVESEDDAFKIISKFSGEKYEDVKKGIKRFNSYSLKQDLYLHLLKSFKRK